MNFTIDIRSKRQATFPSQLLKLMGINVGDQLEITVAGQQAVIKPKKQIALEALRAIQAAFRESGVSQKELQSD